LKVLKSHYSKIGFRHIAIEDSVESTFRIARPAPWERTGVIIFNYELHHVLPQRNEQQHILQMIRINMNMGKNVLKWGRIFKLE
jgi:hypothetical protein